MTDAQIPYMDGTAYSSDDSSKIQGMLKHFDPSSIIEDLENDLRGLSKNKDGTTSKKYNKCMNDEGVSSVIRLVKSRVNRASNSSNYSDRAISNSILALHNNLTREFAAKQAEYEIDKIQLSSIVDMVVRYAESALKQSLMSKSNIPLPVIRALISSVKTQEIVSSRSQSDREPKRGMLNWK